MRYGLFMGALVGSALVGAPLLAHPKLVGSNPAAGSEVKRPAKVQLRFSEKLMPKLSGFTVTMTGMPGMTNHPPMRVKGTISTAADRQTLVFSPTSPLPAGTYRVDWQVIGSDTHRITGGYNFKVN